MNSTTSHNKASLWAVGLMLFALFFGAGNLIFPAFLGQQAGDNWLSAMFGGRRFAIVGRDCRRLFRLA